MLSRVRIGGAAILAILLAGCSADDNFYSSGTGKISVSLDTDLLVSQSKQSRAETDTHDPLAILNELSVDNLSLNLKSDDGSFSKTWENAKSFSEEEEFPVGSYTLQAYYGDSDDEGVDKPHLFGETVFNVVGAKTVPVSLTASVANSIVSIDFTERFKNYFTAYSGRIISAKKNEFLFSGHETTAVYVSPGNTKVHADVTLPSGQSGSVNLGDFEAVPATFHKITLDVDATRGDLIIMLIFDDTLDERVLEREISDELFDAGAPVVTPEGFEGSVPMPFVEGNLAFKEYKFNIAARRGIKELWLTRNSPRYGGGFQERFNLLNEQTRNDLIAEHNIELIGIAEGEMFGKIDLTGWLKDLKRYNRDVATEDVSFTIEVVDAFGSTTDMDFEANNTLNVKLYGETLAVELDESSITDDSYNIKVSTNMNWIQGRLNMLQKEFDDEIVPEYIVVDSIIDETYATPNIFTIKIPKPVSMYRIEHQTVSNTGIECEPFTVTNTFPKIFLNYNQNDIFAQHGKVRVSTQNADSKALVEKIISKYNGVLEVSLTDEDGINYTLTSNSEDPEIYEYSLTYPQYKIDSKEPLFLIVSAVLTVPDQPDQSSSDSKSFYSEIPLQIPYSGFDDWNCQKIDTYKYLWKIGNDDSPWATLNSLTCTSSGSSYSYVGTSGTIPANGRSRYSHGDGGTVLVSRSEGHTNGNANLWNDRQASAGGGSNTNAAIIRTVGWGSGNTAVGNSSSLICKNQTPGRLFLGTYINDNTDPEYGYAFPSRPDGMRFWYHYDVKTPGNGDIGQAIIRVLDENGNLITEKSFDITEKAQYTLAELKMEYPENSAKAAKIEITFISSIVGVALNVPSIYWDYPRNTNLSGGEYVGSELYIDEVELIY